MGGGILFVSLKCLLIRKLIMKEKLRAKDQSLTGVRATGRKSIRQAVDELRPGRG